MLEQPVQDGASFLFCSDGLHGMLADGQILDIVSANGTSMKNTIQDLIAAANAAGGRDNVTALMLRYRFD